MKQRSKIRGQRSRSGSKVADEDRGNRDQGTGIRLASARRTGGGMTATPRHIHLIGICGTAMASLAGLLQLRGHRISGSDKAAYPPMSDVLHELGIPVLEPYAESNLDPKPDLVVVGNALSRGNVELEHVL